MQMSTYSIVVISVIVQNTSESMPITAVSSAWATPPWPARKVCIV